MYINILFFLIASGSVFYTTDSGGLAGAGVQERQLVESSPIAGSVIEHGSGLPVQHVIIRWKGSSESVITDAEGEFRIQNKISSKKLLISKPGWMEKSIPHRRIKKMKSRVKRRGEEIILIVLRKSKRSTLPEQPEEDLPPGDYLPEDLPPDDLPRSANHTPVEGAP